VRQQSLMIQKKAKGCQEGHRPSSFAFFATFCSRFVALRYLCFLLFNLHAR